MCLQRAFPVLILFLSLAFSRAQSCPNSTLPTSIEALKDPSQQPVAFLVAKGIRSYNCSTGTPSLNSGGAVIIEQAGPWSNQTEWKGAGIYPDSNGNGTFVISVYNNTDNPKTLPLSSFNLTLDYSTVLFFPSPDGALSWARWSVFTVPENVQGELGMGWGARVDTVGGAEPESCDKANSEKEVIVPYTANYYFYPCSG